MTLIRKRKCNVTVGKKARVVTGPCASVVPGTRQLCRPAGNQPFPYPRHLKCSSQQMAVQDMHIRSTTILYDREMQDHGKIWSGPT